MDLLSTRTIELTKFAMDGLMMRQKAITANTANVMTPGYQRKEVDFESQLREIASKEDLKTTIKEQNSMQYNPTSLDVMMGNDTPHQLTPQEARYLKTDLYNKDNFDPQIVDDVYSGAAEDGNNVDMEAEVMDMAKVGMKYSVLATLEQKSIAELRSAIKGDGS